MSSSISKSVKRRRVEKKQEASSCQTSKHGLARLPFELVAEVMSYMKTPKDLLSVARLDQHLCSTLLNPSFEFVWKRVRRVMQPPLPDPLPYLTESSYAAFVFDGGDCQVCGKETSNMYSSYSLKVRLCSQPECKSKAESQFYDRQVLNSSPSHVEILRWFPVSELYQEHLLGAHLMPYDALNAYVTGG
jgi:hypothetical protein